MSTGLKIHSTKVEGRTVKVFLGNNDSNLSFEDCWLRDHCRCPKCYHADTFQRANHILDIPDSRVKSISHNDNDITIIWDDNHQSKYDLNFLYQNDYQEWTKRRQLRPSLWKGADVASKVARVPIDQFLNSIDGAKLVFQSLLDYGVALIDGVEATSDATERVCEALGGVQHTLFGGMWSFTTRPDHADTAYTNLPLATHNDGTYFTEAAGLQILHCLEHNGSGGETILADGFYGATLLQEDAPEDFEFLSTHDVEAEYIESGHHHRYSTPIIQLDPKTYQLKQIRFNVYDRSPMPLANGTKTRTYYRSLRNLASYYQDPKNQWQFKLEPGLVMVMDNFRVLHGRTAFTGARVLCGSYVARSDWLSRARVLKIIQ